MPENTFEIIRQMVGRMPQWLRAHLSATDPMLRERAEDALSAMIVAAIGTTGVADAGSPHSIEPATSTSV